jgi:hypothetical protein
MYFAGLWGCFAFFAVNVFSTLKKTKPQRAQGFAKNRQGGQQPEGCTLNCLTIFFGGWDENRC